MDEESLAAISIFFKVGDVALYRIGLMAGSVLAVGIFAFSGAWFRNWGRCDRVSVLLPISDTHLQGAFLVEGERSLNIWASAILYLLLRSGLRHRRGTVSWKGRKYTPSSNTMISPKNRVGAGVPTCPAERSSANVYS